MASEIPRRPLGRTGEQVSAIGLGGWHIGHKSVDEALGVRLIRTAIDRGITFLDNSWDYNEGLSEERMGRALKDGYRQRAFLMTKIDGRSLRRGDAPARHLPPPPPDRLHRSRPASRGHPIRRSRSDVRRRRRQSGARGRAACGQDPIHRVHRTQGSGDSPLHASGRARSRLSLRRRADAVERDGRALPELRAARPARARSREHRCGRHEVDGQRDHPAVRGRLGRRMSSVFADASDVGARSPASNPWRSSTRRATSPAVSRR